jgi:ribosomal protein L11 methyltransferase
MPWLALSVKLERAAAETFSDALLEAGAQSVCLEPDGKVDAILAAADDPQALVAAAASAAGIVPPRFNTEALDDQDWVRKSQEQFPGSEIGERLWVGPTWRRAPERRIAIYIDPGFAFGTGTHPSTKLVLDFLEKSIKGGERVLDYGCGSGILAIAAAKLGAAQVHAVDLDPQAVETTRANAAANRAAVAAELADSLALAHYDVVVSNILAQPLIALAPLLAERGERIALAGILDSQAEEVARAYRRWFEMRLAAHDEGWVLLAGCKK